MTNPRTVLAELVEIKDVRRRLRELHEMGHGTDYGDIIVREAEAWTAARAVLAQPPAPLLTDEEMPPLPEPTHYEFREPRERYDADQLRADRRAVEAAVRRKLGIKDEE